MMTRAEAELVTWGEVEVQVADCSLERVRGFEEPRLFGPERYRGAFPVDGWPQSDIGLSAGEAVAYGVAVFRDKVRQAAQEGAR